MYCARPRARWSGSPTSPRSVDEIVLERIDRLLAVRRRGPRQRGVRRAGGDLLQLVGARHASRHRAPDFERVQRRHSRTPVADFDGRERDVET